MTDITVAKVCSIENCGNPVRVISRGWCFKHYQRWLKRGDPLKALHIRNGSAICVVEGCSKKSHAREMCQGHYKKLRQYGDPLAYRLIIGNDEARFWLYVDKTPGFGPDGECWKWTGCTESRGYGMLWVNGRMINAHRFSFFLKHGKYPEPTGRHECDTPGCVNYDHILEGTQQENMDDKMRRGRHRNQYGPC